MVLSFMLENGNRLERRVVKCGWRLVEISFGEGLLSIFVCPVDGSLASYFPVWEAKEISHTAQPSCVDNRCLGAKVWIRRNLIVVLKQHDLEIRVCERGPPCNPTLEPQPQHGVHEHIVRSSGDPSYDPQKTARPRQDACRFISVTNVAAERRLRNLVQRQVRNTVRFSPHPDHTRCSL